MLGAENRSEPLRAIDAVLQRDDACVGSDQRKGLLGGRLGIPQLDREHHDVHRSDPGWIVGDVRLGQMKVAERTLHLEAGPAHRFEIGPACDEEHVVPGRRQARAEIAPDGPGCHNCDPHLPYRSGIALLLHEQDSIPSKLAEPLSRLRARALAHPRAAG